MAHIGARIRELRRAQGLTQENLGERTGINYKYIGLIERGERTPMADTLVKIAAGLRVEVGELFRTSGPQRLSEREKLLQAITGILADKKVIELKRVKRILDGLFEEV